MRVVARQSRRRIVVKSGAGLAALGLALGAAVAQPSQTRPSRPEPEVEYVIDGDPVLKLIPKDTIVPIDAPEMVPAAEAAEFMRDDELVLGVFDGQQARAWSTWHLDRHEVVNDRLGETPIAATW